MEQVKHWSVPKMWYGGECWILGGGFSLPRQFGVPESIIDKVMKKQLPRNAYNEYLKPIYDKHILGTNSAFVFGNWIDVVYFGDITFWRNNMIELHNYKGLLVTDTGSLPYQDPTVIGTFKKIKRLKRDLGYGLSTKSDQLRWNTNAGSGAINLAYLFGVKKIYLLGFDMKTSKDGTTHWQSGYAGYNQPTSDKAFKRFLERMDKIAEDAKKLKLEIINVSTDSAISQFPKVSLKEVL